MTKNVRITVKMVSTFMLIKILWQNQYNRLTSCTCNMNTAELDLWSKKNYSIDFISYSAWNEHMNVQLNGKKEKKNLPPKHLRCSFFFASHNVMSSISDKRSIQISLFKEKPFFYQSFGQYYANIWLTTCVFVNRDKSASFWHLKKGPKNTILVTTR